MQQCINLFNENPPLGPHFIFLMDRPLSYREIGKVTYEFGLLDCIEGRVTHRMESEV